MPFRYELTKLNLVHVMVENHLIRCRIYLNDTHFCDHPGGASMGYTKFENVPTISENIDSDAWF